MRLDDGSVVSQATSSYFLFMLLTILLILGFCIIAVPGILLAIEFAKKIQTLALRLTIHLLSSLQPSTVKALTVEMSSALEEIGQHIEQTEIEASRVKLQNSYLKDKIQDLEKARDALIEELGGAPDYTTIEFAVWQQAIKIIDYLVAERMRLIGLLDEVVSAGGSSTDSINAEMLLSEIVFLKNKTNELKESNKKEIKQLKEFNKKEVSEFREKVNRLEREKSRLEKSNSRLEEQRRHWESDQKQFQNILENWKLNYDELKNKNSSIEEEHKKLTAQIDSTKEEFSQIKEELKQKELKYIHAVEKERALLLQIDKLTQEGLSFKKKYCQLKDEQHKINEQNESGKKQKVEFQGEPEQKQIVQTSKLVVLDAYVKLIDELKEKVDMLEVENDELSNVIEEYEMLEHIPCSWDLPNEPFITYEKYSDLMDILDYNGYVSDHYVDFLGW